MQAYIGVFVIAFLVFFYIAIKQKEINSLKRENKVLMQNAVSAAEINKEYFKKIELLEENEKWYVENIDELLETVGRVRTEFLENGKSSDLEKVIKGMSLYFANHPGESELLGIVLKYFPEVKHKIEYKSH